MTFILGMHDHVRAVGFEVRAYCSRAEMCSLPEHRIADVIIVRHLDSIEQDRALDLARVADHAILADDHVAAQVGTVPYLAILTDDCGRLYSRAIGDADVLADEYSLLYLAIALGRVPKKLFDDLLNSRDQLPRVFALAGIRCEIGRQAVEKRLYFDLLTQARALPRVCSLPRALRTYGNPRCSRIRP